MRMSAAMHAIQATPSATLTRDATFALNPDPAPRRLPTRTFAAIPNAIGPVMKVKPVIFSMAICAFIATCEICDANTTVTSNDDASAATMTAPRLPSSNILLHMHGVVVRQTSVSAPFNVHLGASCWTPSSSSVSPVESSTRRLTGAPKPLTSTTALHWSEKRKYAATRIKLTTLDVVVASAEPFNPRFIILMKSTLSAMLSKKVAKLVQATGLTTPRTCRNFCMTRVHAAANRPTISKVQNLPTRSDVYSSWLRIVRAMLSPHERTMAAGTQHAVRKAAARNAHCRTAAKSAAPCA
mmetsp:Transcript_1719/g.6709  ORF Transcript_1719/g.6709 Transcript_1719/m.6709 type:complete len:297 (-) Transcript_1719:308-1198(-)